MRRAGFFTQRGVTILCFKNINIFVHDTEAQGIIWKSGIFAVTPKFKFYISLNEVKFQIFVTFERTHAKTNPTRNYTLIIVKSVFSVVYIN